MEGKILLLRQDPDELNPYQRYAIQRGRAQECPLLRIDPRCSGEHLELCRGHRPERVFVSPADVPFVLPAVREGFEHVVYRHDVSGGGSRFGGTLFTIAEDGTTVPIPTRKD